MRLGHEAGIGKALLSILLALGLMSAARGQTPTKEYIYLGGRLVAIESTGPAVGVSPSVLSIPAAGGTGAVAVTAGAGVAWNSAVNAADSWIVITGGVSGTGNGAVTIQAGVNAGELQRQGTIVIGGTTVTVTQAGAGASATGALTVTTTIFRLGLSGGQAVTMVEAPAGVAWTAAVTSGASWLTITGGASATGGGFPQLSALQATSGRVGTIAVSSAGRPDTIIYVYQYDAGGGPVPTMDSPDGVSPTGGATSSATFSFSASTTAGGAYVAWIQALVKSSLDGREACYLWFDNQFNRVYMMDDAGVTWLDSGRLGEDKRLENSQCSVNLATATKTISGNRVTFQTPIAFKPIFAGTQNVYMYSGNMDGGVSAGGWLQKGTWTPYPTPAPPTLLSVNPSSGTGPSQLFSFRMSSPAGARFVSSGHLLIHTSISGEGGCYLTFDRISRTLTLVPQAGQAGGTGTMGAAGTIENNYCLVDLAASSVAENGNELILTVAATFKAPFYGSKNVYLYAADRAGQAANWTQMGNWTAGATAVPVSISSVKTNGTAGTFTNYEIDITAPAGAGTINQVEMIIGPNGADSRDSCHVNADLSANVLRLDTDASTWGKAPMWFDAPYGSFGGTGVLENSQCKVSLANSGKTALNSSVMRVRVALEYLPMFAGTKSIYAIAYSGGNSTPGGYQNMGSETRYPAPAPPVAVTTPVISGTGLSGTFTFRLQSPLGGDFIHSGVALIDSNPNFNADPSKWCKILYHRSSQRVVLPTPSGTQAPFGYIGDTVNTSVATANCRVNLQSATLQKEGNGDHKAVFPVEFLGAFSGMKQVALIPLDKALQFAQGTQFATVGSWNVTYAAVPISVSPSTATAAAEGGAGSFSVVTAGTWAIGYTSGLVTVQDAGNGATGSGNRTFAYTVAGNPSTSPRNVAIVMSGQNGATATHTISQAGQPVCVVSPLEAYVAIGQSLQFSATIGDQSAGAAGYAVTWGLYRKDGAGAYLAADSTYGTISGGGLYQPPAGGTPTAYARASCAKGSYALAPAYGKAEVRSYYPLDCNYRVSLSDANGVGRYVEMLLWQQSNSCGGTSSYRPAVEMLVAAANASSAAGQCHLTYYPGGSQMLSLLDDTGLTAARTLAWYPIRAIINQYEQVSREGSGMTQNSQCLVDYARAWEKAGNPPEYFLKWNVPLYFHPSFAGGKDIKLREQSLATPWTSTNALVPWTVPTLANEPPAGQIQTPPEGATVSRASTVVFTGWALDNATKPETAIQKIKVYMDGAYLGLASYSQASTVCGSYPGRAGCPNVGFTFEMAGSAMAAGEHLFEFVVRDSDSPTNLLKVLSRKVIAQ